MRDFRVHTSELDGASILVTGGSGSFGRRFIRNVLDEYQPRRLVVFSRDELKQWRWPRISRKRAFHACAISSAT